MALMINGQISETDRIDEWDYLVTILFFSGNYSNKLCITLASWVLFLKSLEFSFEIDFGPINSIHARTSYKFWGGGQDQGGRRDRFYSWTGAARFCLIWFHFYS